MSKRPRLPRRLEKQSAPRKSGALCLRAAWSRVKDREAPVRIELTNSRFAVCRLTTWPRRRAGKLSGSEVPEQSGYQDPERQSCAKDHNEDDQREDHSTNRTWPLSSDRPPLREMTLEQRHVLRVCFPGRIKNITKRWNSA